MAVPHLRSKPCGLMPIPRKQEGEGRESICAISTANLARGKGSYDPFPRNESQHESCALPFRRLTWIESDTSEEQKTYVCQKRLLYQLNVAPFRPSLPSRQLPSSSSRCAPRLPLTNPLTHHPRPCLTPPNPRRLPCLGPPNAR